MSRDAILHLSLEEVVVPQGRRPLNAEMVERLADSIKQIGLQHPITVRSASGVFTLIAGHHRLQAMRRLGEMSIPATVAKVNETDARLWEISENLHRADLTRLERDEQIAEWIAITEARQAERVLSQVATKPQGGRPEAGVRAAARELGVDKDEAHRALKVASISERAKQAAVESRLDNNQAALLRIASVTPDQQVEKVREEAAERDRRREMRKPVSPAPEPRNAFESEELWLAKLVKVFEAAPQEWRDRARDHLYPDVPVMDRRHG